MTSRAWWIGLVVLGAVASCSDAQESDVSTPRPQATPRALVPFMEKAIPGLWFVELQEAPVSRGGDRALVLGEHARFRARAATRVGIKERFQYDQLWNGLAVELVSGDPTDLAVLPGVRAIYPVVQIERDQMYDPQHQAGLPEATNEPDLYSALGMSGADIAQNNLGLDGTGVRVGVIDTGIDYDHPDLGGCFGPACRVAFGVDLVGDKYDAANNSTQPVGDPFPDDCAGHGTHVAGIIGAKGTIKGVAPAVTFGAYRVFGCVGSTSADVMLEAMELASKDGMRVVNMSIGSSYAWAEYPTAVAADQLVADGVVVVASIGNSGASGTYAAGAPGTGDSVIGVAAIDNVQVTQPAFTTQPANKKYGFNPATGAPPPPASGTFPLVRTGTVTSTTDACSALAAGSLNGSIALIRRGGCTFYIKSTNAIAAGAVGVVLYNNVAGALSPTVVGNPAITVPVVALTSADGAAINGEMDNGAVTLTWGNEIATTASPTGGLVSNFSSYGLTQELELKPDIAAPGGSIYSTYPVELGRYASLSGTSMASPHVAGTAALMLQAHPTYTPADVATALLNNAVPAKWAGAPMGPDPDGTQRQGAGMVRIDAAAQATVFITPAKLALGESQAGPASRTLTLENTGGSDVTFDLSAVGAVSTTGVYTAVDAASGFATVQLGAPSVTVPAGGTATVDVTITADAALAQGALYGGYVVFTPQGAGTPLRVPYAGFKGDYQAMQVITTPAAPNDYPWLAKKPAATFLKQAANAMFTLQNGDLPWVVVHLDHAARQLKIELYDAVKNKPWGSVVDEPYMTPSSGATAHTDFQFNGTTVLNKQLTKVPNGTYVFKLSVLKALGDPNNPAHWETWTSPAFVLNHP